MSKVKERVSITEREKITLIYKGTPIRLLVDFSAENKCRPEGSNIFKVLKGKTSKNIPLPGTRTTVRTKGERVSLTSKSKSSSLPLQTGPTRNVKETSVS